MGLGRLQFMPSKGLSLSLCLGLVLLSGAAFAQTPVPGTPYTRIDSSITYTPLSNPTIVINSGGSSDEAEIQLPFEFDYYGQKFTTVTVGNAGAMVFASGAQISTVNQTPGSSSLDGWIGPWWDTMYTHAGQTSHVAYQVGGTAPNRWITIEWNDLNHNVSSTGALEPFDFQVRLFEGLAGRIEIDYGPRAGTPIVSATMGMESPLGNQPILFAGSNCTTSCQLSDYDALINQRITLVQDPGVELVALSVQAPRFATLGVDTPVTVSLGNLNGSALGPFTVDLVASTDEAGTNPTVVGSLDLSLAPYSTQEVDLTMNGPVSLGESSYYLTLVVDVTNTVAEVDESNNTAVSTNRVRFLPSLPDISIDRVVASQTTVSAGDPVDVELTITNAGSQPIAGGEVAVMLSSNIAISPQDVELDRFTVDLAPAETITENRTVTIPAGANSGTYWLGGLGDPENTLGEVSEANNGRAATTDLAVSGGSLAIITTALPTAIVSRGYVAIVSAVGGGPDVDFQVTGGMLPPGIGLVAQTGEFYGRAQTEGVYNFTIEATSGAQSDTADLSITVSDPDEPLTIVTRNVPAAVVGQEYMVRLRATGGAVTSSLTWSATGLPEGLTLAGDGVLAGSAVAAGTSNVELTVSNGMETASREITLVVAENANLQIIPEVLPTGVWNMPYSATIRASGGIPPVNFILELGELPEGLELSTDGTISGTPTQVGRFRLVIKALDSGSGGIAATDVNTFELVIEDAPGFEIETGALPEAVVGEGYQARVVAKNGLAPLDWSLDGRPPSGMIAQIDPMSGDFVILGTAEEAGVTNLLVSVVDSQGRQARKAFVLTVREMEVDTTPKDEEGCGCTSSERSAGAGDLALFFGLVGLLLSRRRR